MHIIDSLLEIDCCECVERDGLEHNGESTLSLSGVTTDKSDHGRPSLSYDRDRPLCSTVGRADNRFVRNPLNTQRRAETLQEIEAYESELCRRWNYRSLFRRRR